MCILSSKDGEKINGCIVNSVFQITAEPLMVAVSINKASLTREYITLSRVFAVSVLSEDATMPFIRRFGFNSGRDIDKFEGVRFRKGDTASPIVLDGAAAFLEAEVTGKIDVETHTLFIGRILSCDTVDEDAVPMTYAYYRDVKRGRTPKSAATYHEQKTQKKLREKDMKKYKCLMCGYIYDPAVGDPDNGADAGTAFENLPDDWVCPECGAGKDEFEPSEE